MDIRSCVRVALVEFSLARSGKLAQEEIGRPFFRARSEVDDVHDVFRRIDHLTEDKKSEKCATRDGIPKISKPGVTHGAVDNIEFAFLKIAFHFKLVMLKMVNRITKLLRKFQFFSTIRTCI
jgi:hypothetical protein